MKIIYKIFLLILPTALSAQRYCPEKLFIIENTIPEKFYSFSTNDTLLICGSINKTFDGDKHTGLFAFIDNKTDSIFKYFTETDIIDLVFKNDTLKIIEHASFLSMDNDSYNIQPFVENTITPSLNKGLELAEKFILQYPKLHINKQKDIIQEHRRLMTKEKITDFENYNLTFIKNLDKLFYCALNGNKEAEYILQNYETIWLKNGFEKDYFDGEPLEAYFHLLKIYSRK